MNAGEAARRPGIDAAGQRVSVRAAGGGCVKRAGDHDVVDEPAGAAQQPTIFETQDAAPEKSRCCVAGHSSGPCEIASRAPVWANT